MKSQDTFLKVIFFVSFCLSVLDDEEDEGVVTTGSIVTVAVTLKRRNLGASVNFFAYNCYN